MTFKPDFRGKAHGMNYTWTDKPIPKHKYGVQTTPLGKLKRTYRGICFDSMAECLFAQYLDAVEKPFLWIPQPKVFVSDSVIWKLDFIVHTFSETTMSLDVWMVDVKGYETVDFRTKKALYQERYQTDRENRIYPQLYIVTLGKKGRSYLPWMAKESWNWEPVLKI